MDKLLDVKIDNLTKTEIRQKVEGFLEEDKFHQIATINPEFILKAQKNIVFKNILNSCDLNIADGFGIKLAFWRYGKNLKYRLTGADLMDEILQIANEKKLSIFLATNKNGLSSWEETRDAILKTYPDLEINGENINMLNTEYQIPDTKCQILFCNFGAPHQEIFLRSQKSGLPHHPCSTKENLHITKLLNGSFSEDLNLQQQWCRGKIRLAIGIGGSFDYLTGKTPRAPKFLRQMGLEWLWRLMLQPKRWKRIWNAIIIFPIRIISCKEK